MSVVPSLLFVLLLLLLLLLYHLHRTNVANLALREKGERAGEEVRAVVELLRHHRPDGQVEKMLLRLEDAAVSLGAEKMDKGRDGGEVCPERYIGNRDEYPYLYHAWVLEECEGVEELGELVTVLVSLVGEKSAEKRLLGLWDGLKSDYPGVELVVAVDKDFGGDVVAGLEVVRTERTNPWGELVARANTRYVLLGIGLEYISGWVNLHRAVRLLGRGGAVRAVGGAVRNNTGHWGVGCYQVGVAYYRLEMRQGYERSDQDCMVCDYAAGPLVVERDRVDSLNTDLSGHVNPVVANSLARVQIESSFLHLKGHFEAVLTAS